jgi:hypothetical protein
MNPNSINSDNSKVSLDYKEIGDFKQILKFIFVRRIQVAVLLRDTAIGKIEVNPTQVQASKVLIGVLADMERTARQNQLDSVYDNGESAENDNFFEGIK